MVSTILKRLKKYCLGLGLLTLGFASGIALQKSNAFQPLKRIWRGLPASAASPSLDVLLWNAHQSRKPQYALDGLEQAELDTQRRIYQEKIKDLLGFSHYPLQYRPAIEIVETTSLNGGLLREKIFIETEPGLRVPFYLFLPDKTTKPLPAILVLHGHSAGKIETAGLLDSYQHGNALALAKAGYVVAAPDFRGFGELGWTGDWNDPIGHAYGRNIHIQDVLSNLERGRTVLGTYLYDLQHILNYMKTRSAVDRDNLAVAGTSMGADTALWLSILFPEFKAAVISYPPMISLPSPPSISASEHPCVGTIPNLTLFFNPEEILLLAAPLPTALTYHSSEIADHNATKLSWLYKTGGNAEKLTLTRTHAGEDFDNESAIAWFKKWLN